jgi:uncharacterized protein YndB with AHSA1/START domain
MTKQIYSLKFPVNVTAPELLYELLATPNGLQEWFADSADARDHMFTFVWDSGSEKAVIVEREQNRLIRFHWMRSPDGEYFEFRIEPSSNGRFTLVITDFAEANDADDKRQLWEHQVKDLLHRLGS